MKTSGNGDIIPPFLTSALYEGEKLHVPATSSLEKVPPVPTGQKAGFITLWRSDLLAQLTFQPIACSYTD
jgi:hypothetical protein